MKIALVSTVVPPGPTGQARVLGHQLAHRAADDILLLCDQPLVLIEEEGPPLGKFVQLEPARFYMLEWLSNSRIKSLDNQAAVHLTIEKRARQIAKEALAHGSEVIVGCSGNPYDLPAAFRAASKLKLPFIAYLFDDPVLQWSLSTYRKPAEFWEKRWARRASAIIVPNETLRDDFVARRPGTDPVIVRNPVPDEAFREADMLRPENDGSGPVRIVYTGTVYHAQADAFRNLIEVLDELGGSHELCIHTYQTQADLDNNGVSGPHVRLHPHLTQEQCYAVQRQADILFLPLAFKSDIQDVIRSSAPGKTAEYLASGRPVLAHVPEDSFIARFFREHQCGALVDQPDSAQLKAALEKLEDASFVSEVTRNARTQTREFSVARSRAAFDAVVNRAKRGTSS